MRASTQIAWTRCCREVRQENVCRRGGHHTRYQLVNCYSLLADRSCHSLVHAACASKHRNWLSLYISLQLYRLNTDSVSSPWHVTHIHASLRECTPLIYNIKRDMGGNLTYCCRLSLQLRDLAPPLCTRHDVGHKRPLPVLELVRAVWRRFQPLEFMRHPLHGLNGGREVR